MSELLPLESLSKTKRLKILTSAEIEDLYAQPQLTEEERIGIFELNQKEQAILSSNISMASKVDAIIRLGYFKQKQQFFQFNLHDMPDDVNHVVERYFSPSLLDKYTISHVTKINNQKWILQITGYKPFDHTQHLPFLFEKAKKLCRLSVNPVFIFRELLTEITQKKITRPGYSTFQKNHFNCVGGRTNSNQSNF